jgi:hypothetical protein
MEKNTTNSSFLVQFFNTEKSEKVDKIFKKMGVYTGRNISRKRVFGPKERQRLEKSGLKVEVMEYCGHNDFKYGVFVGEKEKKKRFLFSIFGWNIELKKV